MKINNKIVAYGVCIMLSLATLGCSEKSKSKMTENNNSDISTKEIEDIPSDISYKTEFKGEQKIVTPFVNDKRQGIAKWYWENGAIRSWKPCGGASLKRLTAPSTCTSAASATPSKPTARNPSASSRCAVWAMCLRSSRTE